MNESLFIKVEREDTTVRTMSYAAATANTADTMTLASLVKKNSSENSNENSNDSSKVIVVALAARRNSGSVDFDSIAKIALRYPLGTFIGWIRSISSVLSIQFPLCLAGWPRVHACRDPVVWK
jgi:hypothetical protein